MSDRLDWMTELGDAIMQLLSSGIVLTPTLVAVNLDTEVHRGTVTRHIQKLQAAGFVKKTRRGHYRAAGHVVENSDGQVVDCV